MDASESLGGIDFIEFVLVCAVFYFYGQKPMMSEVFDGNGRRGVAHTNSQHNVIERVGERGEQDDRQQDTACDLFASHAGSIAEACSFNRSAISAVMFYLLFYFDRRADLVG